MATFRTQLRRFALRCLPARPRRVLDVMLQLSAATPASWDTAAVQLHEAYERSHGEIDYLPYLYGLLSAARTATAVGADAFTAVELGVAGGNGLCALEQHAGYVEEVCHVRAEVVGFDSGTGLLPSTEPLDAPFALHSGLFPMDEDALRRRLRRAELVVGPVEQTVDPFLRSSLRAPVGFVAHDLDVYSGTLATLNALAADTDHLLPRVHMYFDDLSGYPYSTAVGEWAAIAEFNAAHETRQIGHMAHVGTTLGAVFRFQRWADALFVLHVFDHPLYGRAESASQYPDVQLVSQPRYVNRGVSG